MQKGFTLIELLIVVAIIAILAAIAVPNFLEAQVRSKVAKAKSDMRTYAIALESYHVDNNHYPVDTRQLNELHSAGLSPLASTAFYPYQMWQVQITTPIGYLSGFRGEDPFQQHTETRWPWAQTYTYRHHEWRRDNPLGGWPDHWGCWPLDNGFFWSMDSPGPAGKPDPASAGDITQFLGGYSRANNTLYDATNGTRSAGHIINTNKGIMENLPPQIR